MSRANIRRIILAVIAGYIADGILVVATEQFLVWLIPGADVTPPLYYFVIDLMTQCLYTVIGGYLCCVIARPSQRAALGGLIGLAVLVGTISLVASWKSEPHWYGIALFVVYPPCAWIGWTLKAREELVQPLYDSNGTRNWRTVLMEMPFKYAFRRLLVRIEHLLATSRAFFYLACLRITLRKCL